MLPAPAAELDDLHPFGDRVAAFDDAVDRALDRLRGNSVADRFFYGLSEAANMSALWHLAGLTGIPGRGKPGGREALRLTTLLGAESLLVNQGVKRLFNRRRPIHEGERPHDLRTPLTSSFPSGHASSAFFAASLLSASRGKAPLWFGLAGLVALSRPYVRIHHASDVVAGAGVGLALAAVAKRAWPLP